uniref:Uncharacterized protein n=1 Tax=Anguilla anguilla TaxID=7936 RepID=A0A0E9V032_ANGAN
MLEHAFSVLSTKFSMGFRSGLCDGQLQYFHLVSLSLYCYNFGGWY